MIKLILSILNHIDRITVERNQIEINILMGYAPNKNLNKKGLL